MEISLEKIFKVIKKNLVIIIILAFLGGIGAYFFSDSFIAPVYESTIKLTVNGADESETVAALNNNYVSASKIVKNCSDYFNSKDFLREIQSKANLSKLPKIEVSNKEETTNLTVVVGSNTAENAYNAAVAVGEYAQEFVSNVLSATSMVKITVFEQPEKATSPSEPLLMRNAEIAFLGIVILCIAVFTIIDVVSSKVDSEKELEERYGIPVISVIPDFNERIRRTKKSYNYNIKRGTEEE